MRRAANASLPRGGSARSSKLRRRGAVGTLLASAVAFILALPAFVSAGPLGEVTFYDEGLRSTPDITYTTEGPDGNVWFVDTTSLSSSVPGLGKITPAGTITEYICGETLSGCNEEASLISITAGPEGDTDLWFIDRGTSGNPSSPPSIGRIDSASPGMVEEFSIEAEGGNAGSKPQDIVAGPEGKLWFTDYGATRAIGVFDPSAPEGERVEEFSEAEGLNEKARPRGIVVGSDGALWFTDTHHNAAIGRIDPGTHMIEEFPIGIGRIPGGEDNGSGKSGIVAGPDGDIWFTETKNGHRGICKIEVAQPHEIECFSEGLLTPKEEYGSKPYTLTVADGKLWFTDHTAHSEDQVIWFEGSSESQVWQEGDEFELCNEDESSCATGTYKADAAGTRAQVQNAMESIYGAGNVNPLFGPVKVHVKFVGELALSDIGQTSCKRLSGTGGGCSGSTVTPGGPDAIGSINKYNEISRYPIDGLNGVNSITYVSGGDVWFPGTLNGVQSIGKFGIEVAEVPLTLKINEGEGTVVSKPPPLECAGAVGASCEAEFEEGAEVMLTASPAVGYRFFSWQGCSGGTDGRQCTVTVSEAREVGVKFKKAWNLTVAKTGSGVGTIKNSSNGLTCPLTCSASNLSLFEGQVIGVYANAPGNNYFAGFTGGTGPAAACDGKAICAYTVEEDASLEAVIEKHPKATLSLEKAGGGEAKITGPIWCNNSCVSASGDFYTEPTPEEVTLSWDLKKGTSSIDWGSGAGTCTGSSSEDTGSCTVTMDEAHELVATLE